MWIRVLFLAAFILALPFSPTVAQDAGGSAQKGGDWLSLNQRADGSWAGEPEGGFSDQAATGLALLAYLGAGETHKHGSHRSTVRTGMLFLKKGQRADGWLARIEGENLVRDHAIATLAFTEAYGLTLSPLFKASAQKAVNALLKVRVPGAAWGRTSEPGAFDLVTTTFAVAAMKSAKISGLVVSAEAWAEALVQIEGRSPAIPRDAAMLLLCRILLGKDPAKDAKAAPMTNVLLKNLPIWDESTPGAVDHLYWYFGTLAMFQVGGSAWDKWNGAIKAAVVDNQRKDGDFRGSWDPVGAFTSKAGRPAATSLMIMCMEVYYRYAKVFGGGGGGGARARVARARLPVVLPPSTGGTTEPNDNPYGDVFFKHYGVNPFVDTEDDRLSTFALDVDTASYAIARRFLTDGNLPEAASIRVEEFVNRFPGDEEPPSGGVFRLTAEGMPSPFGGKRYQLLRLSLRAKDVKATERKPARLTFVVDVSGSMGAENRLGLVKKSLRLLVEQLAPEDHVALVTYGSSGRVLLQHTSGREELLAAIERLNPEGATNAEAGIRLGYGEAEKAFLPGGVNRIILCSDGVANVGRTGPESILATIGKQAERGIEISTLGFGMGNYNDILMEQLANKGNGNYAYVDSLNEARRVLAADLSGLLLTVAKDAKVQVEWNPDVVSRYRLLGYENRDVADEDFRDEKVDGGEVGAGHTVTALYELKLHKGAPEGDLGTFRVRFKVPDEPGHVVEESVPLARELLAGEPSRYLRLLAGVAEFAELLRGSYWARDGSYDAVAGFLGDLLPEYDNRADLVELLDLVNKAHAVAKPRSDPPPEERPKIPASEEAREPR